MRIRVSRTFSSVRERPFIDGEWRAMQGDHGVILRWLSMERDLEDIGDKEGRCHMGIVPQM